MIWRNGPIFLLYGLETVQLDPEQSMWPFIHVYMSAADVGRGKRGSPDPSQD